MIEREFILYEQALALKELGFDEPCMYAWCITPKHRVEYDGKISLKTDGNPFGQFYKGKNFNKKYSPNKNKIQCSAPTWKQTFKFFRDKYNLRGSIMDFIDDETGLEWDYEISFIGADLDENGHYKPLIDYSTDDESRKFKTYEKAELGCLIKLIQLVNKSKVL